MDTPICPRTIGPERHWNNLSDEERVRGAVAEKGPCIGSRCAMWVPEHKTTYSSGARLPGSCASFADGDGDTFTGPPSGRGWCADNLRRSPWADPAKDGAK